MHACMHVDTYTHTSPLLLCFAKTVTVRDLEGDKAKLLRERSAFVDDGQLRVGGRVSAPFQVDGLFVAVERLLHSHLRKFV